MGGIESATYNLFWPSIGCFFVAEYFSGPDCGGKLTNFFNDFTYFLALALLIAHVVIMIIGMVKKGKKCLDELQEPKNYLEFLLLLVGISYIANMNRVSNDWCKDHEAFYWIHGILYFVAIGFGLYLWAGKKKNFMIPEIIVIVLMSHSFGNCGAYANPLEGLADDVGFYTAMSVISFFILFFIVLTSLIDQKTDVIDLKSGISYAIICIMTKSFHLGYVSHYGGFLLWCLLLGLIIADLIKCKFEPDKLILPVVALACIGYMYSYNNVCNGNDYHRDIYGVLTLIGAYLGLVCAILLAVLYVLVLVKGKSK